MKYMHTSFVPSSGDIIEYAYVDDDPDGDEARPFFDSVEELHAYERALINRRYDFDSSDPIQPAGVYEHHIAAARRACGMKVD